MRNGIGAMCVRCAMFAVVVGSAAGLESSFHKYDGPPLVTAGSETPEKGTSAMPITVTSQAFVEGGAVPKKFTGEGQDVSPPLRWEGVPEGTRSQVLICDDPDAPGKTWVHWVLYGLDAATRELPEGVPASREVLGGARQGKNDFGKIGYGGPMPPPGHGPHRYYFKIYALDVDLSLDAGADKTAVEKAMTGHILAQGQLMGRYER